MTSATRPRAKRRISPSKSNPTPRWKGCLILALVSGLVVPPEARASQDFQNIFSHTSKITTKGYLDKYPSLKEKHQSSQETTTETRQNIDPIRTNEEVNGSDPSSDASENYASVEAANNNTEPLEGEQQNNDNSTTTSPSAQTMDPSTSAPSSGEGNAISSAMSSPSNETAADGEGATMAPTMNNDGDSSGNETLSPSATTQSPTTTTATLETTESPAAASQTLEPTTANSETSSPTTTMIDDGREPTASTDLETTAPAVSPTNAPTVASAGTGDPSGTSAPTVNATITVTSAANSTTSNDTTTANTTAGPATAAPTVTKNSIVVTVNSSFIVSAQQSNWTTATDALDRAPKQDIDGLTQAFAGLASSVVFDANFQVANILETATVRQYLRRQLTQQQERHRLGIDRKLQNAEPLNATVEYDPSTAVLTGLRPMSACPGEGAPAGSVCFKTFGQYNLDVESSEDPQSVYSIFVKETQSAIDQGALQEQLSSVDPDSIFSIQGASEPVSKPPPPETPPTNTTTTTEPTPEDGDKKADEKEQGGGGLDGVMLGLVIAISVTFFLVMILLAVFFYLKHSTPPAIEDEKDTEQEAEEGDDNKKDPENDPESAVVAPMESYPHDDDQQSNDEEPSELELGPSDEEQRREYRRRVEQLVAEHCPEESENIDKMLDQFKGREKALIAMLENMDEVERELELEQGRDQDDYSEDDFNEDNEPRQQEAAPFDNEEEEAKVEVQEFEPENGGELSP